MAVQRSHRVLYLAGLFFVITIPLVAMGHSLIFGLPSIRAADLIREGDSIVRINCVLGESPSTVHLDEDRMTCFWDASDGLIRVDFENGKATRIECPFLSTFDPRSPIEKLLAWVCRSCSF
jgi:hypothetical protein